MDYLYIRTRLQGYSVRFLIKEQTMNAYKTLLFVIALTFFTGCAKEPNLYLVQEPGYFESRATLEGIDSDGDGVRDDVWNFIAESYPKPEQEDIRQALAHRAKMYQDLVVAGEADDRELVLKILPSRSLRV
jgi:hypothetical protein